MYTAKFETFWFDNFFENKMGSSSSNSKLT